MPAAVRHPDLATTFDNLKLETGDESFEVQVPDFHFDWGVVTDEKAATITIEENTRVSVLDGRNNNHRFAKPGQGHHDQRWMTSSSSDALNTPPSVSGRTGSPAYSSASSAHIMGLTDASTVSGSSLVPTPPYVPLGRGYLPRTSGASDGDGSAQPERVRRFQRVVSAPVARMSPAPLGSIDRSSREMDESIASTSTYRQHTATLRPTLAHSTSSGAVNGDQPSSSHTYTTPGLGERTLGHSTAASTSRRVGGLSRFGGPARRVIPPVDEQEGMEDLAVAPPLIESPKSSPVSTSPPRNHSRVTRTRSPEPLYEIPPASSPPRSAPIPPQPRDIRHDQSPPPMAQPLIPSPPPPERSSRPFDRYGEQENRPMRSTTHNHAASTSALQRVPTQPLQPAHMYSRSSDHMLDEAAKQPYRSPPLQSRQAEMIPSRAAPRPVEPPPRAADTMPAAPIAVAAQGKRSFMVNGTPYERIGTLGRGGSSKVYSVLCHTTRAMYALKRVALDRADAEAYQCYTNEIELLKRLRGHDRIIRLIDHQISFGPGNRPKILMMVMECGEIDFAALLDDQRGKPLNMNFVGLYWQQMLEAVHAVHLENVVHTDLKPANFVLVQGRLKIIDFGIAKAVANDTVNIQRDQQIGTVNYMSPEAIQRMNNQKVLKLSYPSDVWSLGCILYQMIYGSPPFQHIGGGPLPKMNAIANSSYIIDYPSHAIPKPTPGRDENAVAAEWSIRVLPRAIDVMQGCLKYKKEGRLTIPELLVHEFLTPETVAVPSLPAGSTSITKQQMAMLVKFIVEEHGKKPLPEGDTTASDLFEQLAAQNSHSV